MKKNTSFDKVVDIFLRSSTNLIKLNKDKQKLLKLFSEKYLFQNDTRERFVNLNIFFF